MASKKKSTPSRRKAGAASSLSEGLKAAGWPASLPAARLGADGRLLEANRRMRILLALDEEVEFPVAASAVEATWPFFNEEDSKVALWKKLARQHGAQKVAAENGLKTFRLHLVPADGSERLLIAELVRSGDLLKDEASRQALFRSLAHEIRTSVLALKGYHSMIEAQIDPQIFARMGVSLERLDKVVGRLTEFRASLGGGEKGEES